MDQKLIGVIDVSYMFYRSYLLQILPTFSKWIAKWKETEQQKIVNFDGKWKPAGYMGMGCEEVEIFYHIL